MFKEKATGVGNQLYFAEEYQMIVMKAVEKNPITATDLFDLLISYSTDPN